MQNSHLWTAYLYWLRWILLLHFKPLPVPKYEDFWPHVEEWQLHFKIALEKNELDLMDMTIQQGWLFQTNFLITVLQAG